MNSFTTRRIFLHLPRERKRVEELMQRCGLRLDSLEVYYGIFDSDDNLLAGAGLQGNIVKCVAVDACARDLSLTNKLMTELRREASERGVVNLMIFTKPENETAFRSLAFHTIGRAEKAILMESDPKGLSSYLDTLRSLRCPGKCGVIVLNANPLTRGHEYLIKHARKQVDTLYLIPVMEDCSQYTYAERRSMIEELAGQIPGVIVCAGSPYTISAATFPSYFLKQIQEATDTHIELDLNIFATHIAPALGAEVRFAGSEPADALTRRYNELMADALSPRMQVVEIPRLEQNGVPVSASAVRHFMAGGHLQDALQSVPSLVKPYLLAHEAWRALLTEARLSPKPGLVDAENCGAHPDMSLSLLEASADTLLPYFRHICQAALCRAELPELQRIGLKAEREMLKTTGGVNTHRGALFSMSLMLIAVCHLLEAEKPVTASAVSEEIADLAAGISRPAGTHGACVHTQYNAPGALDMARSGYMPLFSRWLPALRADAGDSLALHKLLLLIMTEIDDSNVLHRGGRQGAIWVKEQAEKLLSNLSISALRDANTLFVARNLSAGGAADMLALTLLANSLIEN